jgi:dTMP kinase
MTGILITFEGGEGAGKTTQVNRLAFTLAQQGHTPVVTHEPGATPLGLRLRRLLLDTPAGSVPPRVEALLYAADRAWHVEAVVQPALAAGQIVICDRFRDSSVAYQGYGRRLGPGTVGFLSEFAAAGLTPDLVVLLDIDPREGLTRAAGRGIRADRIESEALSFHERVRAGFLAQANLNRHRYLVLDAHTQEELLAAAIADRVLAVIGDKGVAARPASHQGVGEVVAIRERERER